ncbi:MAG: hypothetical protein U5L45_16105 [Saprospiraceae bacterium]|nr:hypothetical protein [Saprospiraceae bacterium]
MVHFSASPKIEPHSPFFCERNEQKCTAILYQTLKKRKNETLSSSISIGSRFYAIGTRY